MSSAPEGAAASPGLLKTMALLSRRTAGDLVSSPRLFVSFFASKCPQSTGIVSGAPACAESAPHLAGGRAAGLSLRSGLRAGAWYALRGGGPQPQVFPSEHFPLAAARKPRTGGLSSFGFGGESRKPSKCCSDK